MTLDEFRASARVVSNLAEACPDTWDMFPVAGRLYTNDLMIEGTTEAGYTLTIANAVKEGPLSELESDLYEFGISEGGLV